MRLQYGFHFQRKWILLALNCKPKNSLQFYAVPRNPTQFRTILRIRIPIGSPRLQRQLYA